MAQQISSHQRRQYDPVIIDMIIGLVFGPYIIL